jgi:hypothetical protein
LGQYPRDGGQAILQDRLDEDRLLEPFRLMLVEWWKESSLPITRSV